MSANVRGDPDRLEAYTEDALAALEPARDAVEDYADAAAAFNAAGPNDLGSSLEDLGPSLRAELELLQALNAAPAAFAFALRHLDELSVSDGWAWMHVGDLEWFEALTGARLELPGASVQDVVAAAHRGLDPSWEWPWSNGFGNWGQDRLTSPPWWATSSIGAATDAIKVVDEKLLQRVSAHWRGSTWVTSYPRWRAGSAPLMNRITTARTFSRLAPWARRVGWLGPPLAGLGQLLDDWGDPSLTAGDRVARTGAAAMLDGGLGLAGASAGGALGAAIGTFAIPIPGVGTAVGGVAGAVVGGFIGAEIGQTIRQNLTGLIDWSGDRIDTSLEWSGDAAGWTGDRLHDGWHWTGNRLGEGGEWVEDRFGEVVGVGGTVVEWGGDRLDDGADWLGDRADDAGGVLNGAAGWLRDRL